MAGMVLAPKQSSTAMGQPSKTTPLFLSVQKHTSLTLTFSSHSPEVLLYMGIGMVKDGSPGLSFSHEAKWFLKTISGSTSSKI